MKVIVKLKFAYYLGIMFFVIMWGLGLVMHFLVNNRVFPRILDDEGVTTRNGKRYLWQDLVRWERNKLTFVYGGPRITGNVTLYFTNGKVLIGSFPIKNLNEVLNFLTDKFQVVVKTG